MHVQRNTCHHQHSNFCKPLSTTWWKTLLYNTRMLCVTSEMGDRVQRAKQGPGNYWKTEVPNTKNLLADSSLPFPFVLPLLLELTFPYKLDEDIIFNAEKTQYRDMRAWSCSHSHRYSLVIHTNTEFCGRLVGAVWKRWGTAGRFSALVWLLWCMGNRNLCILGKQAVVKKNQTHQPIPPTPAGTAYQTLKFS